MRKIAMALMPVIMFAQYSPALTMAAANVSENYYINASTSIQQFELSTQIAEISSRIAQNAVLPGRFSSINTLSDLNALVELTTKLTSALRAPAEARIAAAILTNVNTLTQQMQNISASAVEMRNIATLAASISQFAAQLAQEATLHNSTLNPNNAVLAANNARYALNSVFTERATNASLPINQRLAIQKVVTETIRNNPKLVIDAIDNYSANNKLSDTQSVVIAKSNEIFSENNQLVLGNPNADVTIVEFNDYNCTFCKQLSSVLQEATQLDNNLRILVKESPSFQANSELAAKAAVAAKRQGLYENFRNTLATYSGPINRPALQQIARNIGLDIPTFESDMQNPAIDRYLAKNVALARSLGFTTTPTIIISRNNGVNNRVLSGTITLSELRNAIENVRGRANI